MITEIGSEFWCEGITGSSNIPIWISSLGNVGLTSSGRGSINFMLERINPKQKRVLLPSYICDSVILPFVKNGYECNFYDINKDLSPNLESIKELKSVGVFFHMGYFGFSTNRNMEELIKNMKKQGVIVVEDITHTLFSKPDIIFDNDFVVASIRKWLGIPSGGLLASKYHKIDTPDIEQEGLVALRRSALQDKAKYMASKDIQLKNSFLEKFGKSEQMLNEDWNAYKIDDLSLSAINGLEAKELVIKRRENFRELAKGLSKLEFIEPIFYDLGEDDCPFFYPIYIAEDRDYIRNKLIENSIYCPIHWPKPDLVGNRSAVIYDNILSIPIDQRYGQDHMRRIIKVFKDL